VCRRLAWTEPAERSCSKMGGTWSTTGSSSRPACRDPDRFPDPDHFDPDRPNNQHFGFGGGIHYCFGAPLARLEGQLGLVALAGVLDGARLVDDPPPYRPNPVLRGPLHLPVELARPVAAP
jgi:cytochrome P450